MSFRDLHDLALENVNCGNSGVDARPPYREFTQN